MNKQELIEKYGQEAYNKRLEQSKSHYEKCKERRARYGTFCTMNGAERERRAKEFLKIFDEIMTEC